MKFFEMLANFFMTPIDSVIKWIDDLGLGLQAAWNTFWHNAMLGTTHLLVEGVAVIVVSYLVYCAVRVMCSNKDETFSEYINKSMIAGLAYFFARYAGYVVLGYIGG